ncbi:hypothetical protein [Clostridium rectalis]|uniref:hypothetical protein n=1 Tax=Clostridium rectalis TaxID=2040295 RepID=UPI000F63152B|nr:hypothetical protein [Clostridium rectalis]
MYFRFPEKIPPNNHKIYVLQIKYADVNGDGLKETLILTGKKPYGENSFIEDITLTVENKITNVNLKVVPKENSGYNPNMFIARFSEDKTPQVLLSINSGGSGGYYYNYVYSFKNDMPLTFFDYDIFNNESIFNAIYENNYKVRVTSENKALKGIIDLTAIRDKEYLSAIYEPNGTLKEPIKGDVLSLGLLSPFSITGSEIFDLIASQRIIGLFNGDTLGNVETILRLDKDKFIPLVTRLTVLM